MRKVFIAGAKRTPVGSFLGALKDVSAPDLAKTALSAALEQSKINKDDIDEVVLGNVLSAGQGQGVARQASINAGISKNVPAYSLNMVCGSGLKALMNGFLSIRAEEYNVVATGGTESMSQAPYLIPGKTRTGKKMGNFEVVDHMVLDGLTDAFEGYHMGVTAENIASDYEISREDQDQFGYASQQKAIEAQDNGEFKEEIVPVEYTHRKGSTTVEEDEHPNRSTDLEKMSKLKPAFAKNGSVTAANSSGLNDGASSTILVSENYLNENSIAPLAEVVAVGQGGVDPSRMGMGPVPAIKQAVEKSGLNFEDIDIFELNEAFASQSLAVLSDLSKEFGVDKQTILDKTNVTGGAISLGHPIGASGNRILVTLLYAMKKRNLKYGVASLCIGGGMGAAVILRNTDIEE